ncbi:hypothetical protein OSTOST_17506 [Ostertagia ostertagi]
MKQVLVFTVAKDVLLYGVKLTQETYAVLIAACAYIAHGYRRFASGLLCRASIRSINTYVYCRVLKSGTFSCLLVFTNHISACSQSVYVSILKFCHKLVSMSNSRWSTTGNGTSSSPAGSDSSDPDVTLRSRHRLSTDHGSDDSAMPPTPPTTGLSRANRPPCLLKELKAVSHSGLESSTGLVE